MTAKSRPFSPEALRILSIPGSSEQLHALRLGKPSGTKGQSPNRAVGRSQVWLSPVRPRHEFVEGVLANRVHGHTRRERRIGWDKEVRHKILTGIDPIVIKRRHP